MPIAAGKYLYMAKTYVKDKYGEEGLALVIARLGPEDRKLYRGIILSTTNYPLYAYQHFLGAMAEEYGEPELVAFSEELAKKMLFGFFGIIARFITIDTALANITKMWRKTFGEGTFETIEKTDRHIILKLTDFVMHDDVPLKSKEMYLYTMSGEVFMRQVISMILGKPVKSRHVVVSRTTYEYYFEF